MIDELGLVRNIIDGLTTDDGISNTFSSKICSILNSDSDQVARKSFLENVTDSISNCDSEITCDQCT